jgi:hypothetical protein
MDLDNLIQQTELPSGKWLIRLSNEVLGPINAQEIVERMFAGQVTELTPLSLGDGEWSPIQEHPGFVPFLNQARAKIKAETARAEKERQALRRRTINRINLAISTLILAAVGFAASYVVITQQPGRSESSLQVWASRHVPLLTIPSARATTSGRGSVGVDSELSFNIDQILIDDAPALVSIKTALSSRRRASGKYASEDLDDDVRPLGTGTGPLTNVEITSAINSRSNLGRLFACIGDEVKRNRDLPSTIRLEFTINNDGRVGEVRIDNIQLEDGPLHQCLKQKVALLRFRAYEGERRNIEIPLSWTAR